MRGRLPSRAPGSSASAVVGASSACFGVADVVAEHVLRCGMPLTSGQLVHERASGTRVPSSTPRMPVRLLGPPPPRGGLETPSSRKWRNWQTHQLEGLAVAIPWGFESPSHQSLPSVVLGCSRGASGFSASGALRCASAFERRVHSSASRNPPSLRSAGAGSASRMGPSLRSAGAGSASRIGAMLRSAGSRQRFADGAIASLGGASIALLRTGAIASLGGASSASRMGPSLRSAGTRVASLARVGGASAGARRRRLGVCWRTPCWRTPIHRLERAMTIQVRTTLTALAVVGVMAIPVRGDDDDGGGGRRAFRAELSAAREVPVVASPARGTFRARLSDDGTSFAYTLNYEGFEGTVTQAHIHIAQPFASGGISVWLCKTAAVGRPGGACRHADVRAAWRRRARGGRRHFSRGRDWPGGTGGSGSRFRGPASPDARGLRLRERALHLRSGRRGARPDPATGRGDR